jgi:heparan-alpha-glucosaminide N-acetyltransferase
MTTEISAASPWLQVRSGRINSIDIFRALTVLVMITVNEWHAVIGLPQWMSHMPADVDAMTFVDAVFPAFLFIVGMSIPFALQQRLRKGDSGWQVQGHVLQRALGLVVIGFFMVNAEDGFHAATMLLPIQVWALLCFVAAFLVWGSLSGGPALGLFWRLGGAGLFVALALLYRGGPDGQDGMTPQWWGILGLIGWAYLIGCVCFALCRGRVLGLLACIAACAAYFALHRSPAVAAQEGLTLLFSQDAHFSHAALVLSGAVTAMLFFNQRTDFAASKRFALAFVFALGLALAAAWLRPEFKISKIHATPSWALYSAAACVLIFAALYQWVDVRGRSFLPGLLEPVAANPLLAYLIPFIVEGLMGLANWEFPLLLRSGLVGILFGMGYAVAVALLVKQLAARGVRLRI